jgi:hypothetical protein
MSIFVLFFYVITIIGFLTLLYLVPKLENESSQLTKQRKSIIDRYKYVQLNSEQMYLLQSDLSKLFKKQETKISYWNKIVKVVVIITFISFLMTLLLSFIF